MASPPSHADADPEMVDRDLLANQLIIEGRRQRREMRRLPKLLLTAAVLVWRTNRRDTALTVGLQLSGALVASLQVLLASYAVRALLAGGNQVSSALLIPLIALAGVTLVGGFSANSGSLLGRLLSIQIERHVTDEVVDIATRVELIEYERPAFYNQLSRVLTNAPMQPYTVVTSMSSFVGGIAGASALVVALLVLSPVLAAIVLAAGVPLWLLARRGGNAEFEFAVKQTVNVRERAYLKDLMTRRESAAEARAYATAPTLRRRFSDLYDDYIAASAQLIRRRYLLAAGSALATAVAATAAMVVLYLLIRGGVLDVARAAGGLVAIRLLTARLGLLVSGASSLFQCSLFLDEYETFRTQHAHSGQEPPAASPDQPSSRSDSAAVGVHLDAVSFVYPNSSSPAVHEVDLDIEPGQVIALVGENGSGKSTLAKLLAGLYEPSSGSICWTTQQGAPVERQQAAHDTTLVLQEFARYQFTVTDNITLGRPSAAHHDEAVEHAVEDAGIAELVASLPQGYDTRLSRQFSGGRELSLGQWQRLALARAFYRDGSIIVLDEPAAALDPRAEHRLYESVRQLLSGRTVVLITHRLRSVREADRIIVMEHGRVVEDGDHDALMRAQGTYAELVTLQQRGGLQRTPDPTSDLTSPAGLPVGRPPFLKGADPGDQTAP